MTIEERVKEAIGEARVKEVDKELAELAKRRDFENMGRQRGEWDEPRTSNPMREWETWGTIEIAIRNPNVRSYMDHWEGRATKAEAERDRLQYLVRHHQQFREESERLRAGLQLIATDTHRLMGITARQTAQSILDGKSIGAADETSHEYDQDTTGLCKKC